MPRTKGHNSNITHYNHGTAHPNAGGRVLSTGRGRGSNKKKVKGDEPGTAVLGEKRARENTHDDENRNPGPINPQKRRKVTGILTDACASCVAHQTACMSSQSSAPPDQDPGLVAPLPSPSTSAIMPNVRFPEIFDARLYMERAEQYARIPRLPFTMHTARQPALPSGSSGPSTIVIPAAERRLDDASLWLLSSRDLQMYPSRCYDSLEQDRWASTYCASDFPIPTDPDAASEADSEDSYAPSTASEDDNEDSDRSEAIYDSDLSDSDPSDGDLSDSSLFSSDVVSGVDEDELEDLKVEAALAEERAEHGLVWPLLPDLPLSNLPLAEPAAPLPSTSSARLYSHHPSPPSTDPDRASRRKRKRRASTQDRAYEPYNSWDYRAPPEVSEAQELRGFIMDTYLRPRRNKGHGYKECQCSLWLRTRLEWIVDLLNAFMSGCRKGQWIAASLEAAVMNGRGPKWAKRVRAWAKDMLRDRDDLPQHRYGPTRSTLDNEELCNELALHLQSKGKYISRQDVVDYMDRPDVKRRFQCKKGVSLSTAGQWLRRMGYRWHRTRRGQYVDGHERRDVVWYRQKVFLPAITEAEHRTRAWILTHLDNLGPRPRNRLLVIWFHDESTFYANDRREIVWVHKDSTATPRAKGEGASYMVADFVSADYGFLRATSTDENARVSWKCGVNRDGYFTSEEVIKQAKRAMSILERDYPDEEHWLVYDNATIHRKRADDALSARRMPKGPSPYPKPEELENWEDTNFGVKKLITDSKGSPLYELKTVKPRRKKGTKKQPDAPAPAPQERRVRSTTWMPMKDTSFTKIHPSGRREEVHQSFYYPVHPDFPTLPGRFKGMAQILRERGLHAEAELPFECPGFRCNPALTHCCCRRVLYNQPDFLAEQSILEDVCGTRGFRVLFLPKFHCELNFIEQVLGAAKQAYRKYPPSTSEDDLVRNVQAALESVSVQTMRHFARRAWKFIDAYRKGSDGRVAAWAAKKYHGHRAVPNDILREFSQAEEIAKKRHKAMLA